MRFRGNIAFDIGRAFGEELMVENMAAGGELAGLKVMVIDDSKTI